MEKKKLTISSPVTFTAIAGTSKNPALGWLEFVLTDDQPNKNKQGIHQEKFASLVESGLYMPVKMAKGEINEQHDEAVPLGAIVTLNENDIPQIVGTASLWKNERPDDYRMLTAMGAAGTPPQISWEILYTESDTDPEGVEWLSDPVLAAATIVGDPAYSGRTPVLSVASTQDDPEKDPPKDVTVKVPVEESSDASDAALLKELEELRAYRKSREEGDTANKLLETRLAVLSEAGVSVSAEELETNRKIWIGMTDEAFAVVANLLKMKETQAASGEPTGEPIVPDVSEDNPKSNIDIVREGLSQMRNDK